MVVIPIRRLAVAFALTVISALPASAQDWAKKMFADDKIDFGVVARGSEAVYRLKLKNVYKETVHISNVRTTCGCSAAEPSKTTLSSREEAFIQVTMDTRKFTRRKEIIHPEIEIFPLLHRNHRLVARIIDRDIEAAVLVRIYLDAVIR